MKNKAFAAALCFCFMLSGCEVFNADEELSKLYDETTAQSTEAPAPETSAAPETSQSPSESAVAPVGSVSASEAGAKSKLTERKLKELLLKYDDPGKLCFKSEYNGKFVSSGFFGEGSYIYTKNGKTVIDTGVRCVPRYSSGAWVYGDPDESFGEKLTRREFETDCSWSADTAKVTVKDYDTLALTAESISYGLSGKSLFTVYAFAKEDEDGLSFIIDPVCMRALGIPTLAYSPEDMRFDIDGTPLYADTLEVKGSKASDRAVYDKLPEEEYSYVRLIMNELEESYDTASGLMCTAVVHTVERLGAAKDFLKGSGTAELAASRDGGEALGALLSGREELFSEDACRAELIDLDFDGSPEIIMTDGEPEYGTYFEEGLSIRIYDIENGEPSLVGELERGRILSGYGVGLCEAVCYPLNAHGWAFRREDGVEFFSYSDKKLNITELTHADENFRYYCLGKEIVPEPVTLYDPFTGEEQPFMQWNGYAGTTLTVMGSRTSDAALRIFEIMNTKAAEMFDILETYTMPEEPCAASVMTYEGYERFAAELVSSFYLKAENTENAELFGQRFSMGEVGAMKPIIYLYPEETTDVSVKVGGARLSCTYPEYGEGWSVTAEPDGKLTDREGKEYYCLYWEGSIPDTLSDVGGFCVKSEDTADFLREKLTFLGLSAREANEFIIYWLPELKKNRYNIISFHTEDYSTLVPLSVTPEPDTSIRVFMTYEPSDIPAEVKEQRLPQTPERKGFTLVEWGGAVSN